MGPPTSKVGKQEKRKNKKKNPGAIEKYLLGSHEPKGGFLTVIYQFIFFTILKFIFF